MDTNSNRIKENHTIAPDILDDLASRFIINIPDNDRSNFVRICFQIELAHWFYLDFYCTGEDNRVLVPCGIKQFASHIFNHIPFLSLHVKNLDNILQEWKQYKMSVPTYGAILMTTDLKHVLLVQSYWAKSSWGFPKGKVNENEEPLHCAIREVYEETGYDIANLAEPDAFIEGVLNYQYTRLYLIRNVPIETVFVPRTRKEIKCCEWFSIEHLPTHKTDPVSRNHLGINANSFFMIMPFVKRLKKWINEQNHPTHAGKNSKGENKYIITIMSNGGGVHAGLSHQQSDSNSPHSVYFQNNATGHRRQRHKSMGDLDSANVVTHDSTGETSNNQTTNTHGQSLGTKHHEHGNNLGSASKLGDDINGLAAEGSNANTKTISGKRKLFSTTNVEQVDLKRSSSPMMDFHMRQEIPHQVQQQQHLKNHNKLSNGLNTSHSKQTNSSNILADTQDNSKKKKNSKQHWGQAADQNGSNSADDVSTAHACDTLVNLSFEQVLSMKTTTTTTSTSTSTKKATKSSDHPSQQLNQQQQQQQNQSESECPSAATPIQWRNIFNPPQLSQLLFNEPSINTWRNVRLNKDIIMDESLKLSIK